MVALLMAAKMPSRPRSFALSTTSGQGENPQAGPRQKEKKLVAAHVAVFFRPKGQIRFIAIVFAATGSARDANHAMSCGTTNAFIAALITNQLVDAKQYIAPKSAKHPHGLKPTQSGKPNTGSEKQPSHALKLPPSARCFSINAEFAARSGQVKQSHWCAATNATALRCSERLRKKPSAQTAKRFSARHTKQVVVGRHSGVKSVKTLF